MSWIKNTEKWISKLEYEVEELFQNVSTRDKIMERMREMWEPYIYIYVFVNVCVVYTHTYTLELRSNKASFSKSLWRRERHTEGAKS